MRRVKLLLLTGVAALAASAYAASAPAATVAALDGVNASSVTVCVTIKGDNKGAVRVIDSNPNLNWDGGNPGGCSSKEQKLTWSSGSGGEDNHTGATGAT